MKNIYWILLAVIILGGGYLLLQNKQQNAPIPNNIPITTTQTIIPSETNTPSGTSTPATQNNQSNTVEYTSNGFQPKTLTVKSGTTVTFVNKDTDDFWPASNPHPTHTDLPRFDALKGIPTNGTYLYTFTKVGTWGYHNHLQPSNKGTIVVTL